MRDTWGSSHFYMFTCSCWHMMVCVNCLYIFGGEVAKCFGMFTWEFVLRDCFWDAVTWVSYLSALLHCSWTCFRWHVCNVVYTMPMYSIMCFQVLTNSGPTCLQLFNPMCLWLTILRSSYLLCEKGSMVTWVAHAWGLHFCTWVRVLNAWWLVCIKCVNFATCDLKYFM